MDPLVRVMPQMPHIESDLAKEALYDATAYLITYYDYLGKANAWRDNGSKGDPPLAPCQPIGMPMAVRTSLIRIACELYHLLRDL